MVAEMALLGRCEMTAGLTLTQGQDRGHRRYPYIAATVQYTKLSTRQQSPWSIASPLGKTHLSVD